MLVAQSGASVVTVDIEPRGVMVAMDLHRLGFPDECFNLILCSHVLEHVRDDMQCMRELFRVFKVGGIAILPVPVHEYQATVEFGFAREDLGGHVREYGHDYFNRLAKAGFSPIPEAQHIAAVTKQCADGS